MMNMTSLQCPNAEPHEPHEWYGKPAVFRLTCPGVFEHRPTINRFPFIFSTQYIYWVYCSCGQYMNRGKQTNDLNAWKAWVDHARSKGPL